MISFKFENQKLQRDFDKYFKIKYINFAWNYIH